jgi:MFS superfamily sulfate permease-like transporter
VPPHPTDLSTYGRELRAGLQVSLLALPLCLGIAVASGVPPAAGLLTAIVGGLLGGVLGGARRTIKGPAAGLIVIVAGTVLSFGGGLEGYRALLAVGTVSGLVQLVLAQARVGRLLRFVPPAVVQGMLCAIGLLILLSQLPVVLGVSVAGEGVVERSFHLVMAAPALSPWVLLVAVVAGAVLLLHRRLPEGVRSALPAPLAAVVVGVGVAFAIGLPRALENGVGPYLQMPSSLGAAMMTPDFTVLFEARAWWWVAILSTVGSLESLLSVRAIDRLADGESDLDADLRATGAANVLAALIGGLPMISEVVRSTACVTYGGRGRLANAVHGVALLVALVALGGPLGLVPLAALAVLLIDVGFRLASPATLRNEVALGYDQLLIFAVTLVASLTVDLLVGVGLGVLTKLGLHVLHGAPLSTLLRPRFEAASRDGQRVIRVRDAAVFSSFHGVREAVLASPRPTVLDLSGVRLVDHTVMTEVARLEAGGVIVEGLDDLVALGPEPTATRVRQPLTVLLRRSTREASQHPSPS